MGYNARNDEIRDNITRMRREWEARRDVLATVRRFNARLSAKGYSWLRPAIAAALTSKHHLVGDCVGSANRYRAFQRFVCFLVPAVGLQSAACRP
ncbi:MAG: hypothetical protein WCE32_15695, partial [Pseudolabrys sp.]